MKSNMDETINWYQENQDPQIMEKMKSIGKVVNNVSMFVGVGTAFYGKPYLYWSIASFACFIVCVFLLIKYPAYFSLIYDQKHKNNPDVIGLFSAFAAPLGMMAIRSLSVCSVLDWSKTCIIAVAFTIILACILKILVPELRKDTKNWLILTIVLASLSIGAVLPVNHFFCKDPPKYKAGILVDQDYGHKGSTSIDIKFADGSILTMHRPFFSNYDDQIGKKILLEQRKGALGIEYLYFE